MKHFFYTVLFWLAASSLYALPTIDGTINAGEYAYNSNNYYMDWDANNLYIGVADIDANFGKDGIQLYVDVTDATPVNSGTGSMSGLLWDGVDARLPFNADYFFFVENGYETRQQHTGSWSAVSEGMTTAHNGGARSMEIQIPWSDFGGRPASFRWLAFRSYYDNASTNGLYGTEPLLGNPSGGNGVQSFYYYQSIPSVGTAPTESPFSNVSFTYYGGGDYNYTSSLYSSLFDMTVYDGSSTTNGNNYPAFDPSVPNRITLNHSISVRRNLVVGANSALFAGSAQTVTFTQAATPSNIWLAGRLDCNADVNVLGNRLSMAIAANKTVTVNALKTSDVPNVGAAKALRRFSTFTINSGATLKAPDTATGSEEIEFQFGTMTNNGTIDFKPQSGGGYMDVTIRGSILPTTVFNQYEFRGTGLYDLRGLLIGNTNARLTPQLSDAPIQLNVYGDFQVYHHFRPNFVHAGGGTGALNIVMKGNTLQRIRTDKSQLKNNDEADKALLIFNNLTIDKPSGDVYIDHDPAAGHTPLNGSINDIGAYVEGSLTLTQGRIFTRHSLTGGEVVYNFGNRMGALTTTGNNTSHVHGPMVKFGSEAFTYPVGKGGFWARLGITAPATASTYFVAEYFNAGQGSTTIDGTSTNLYSVSQKEYWQLDRSATSTDEIKVTLYWEDAGRSAIFNTAKLKVAHFDGADWDDNNPLIDSTTTSNPDVFVSGSTGYITSANTLTSFSPLTFGSATNYNNFPVELLYFKATVQDKQTNLTWATATEQHSAYFEVQHSADGKMFKTFEQVHAAGNSTERSEYQVIHPSPVRGINYYRLRQVDLDGQYVFSPISSVYLDDKHTLVVYPSPARGELVSFYAPQNGMAHIRLYNSSGMELMNTEQWLLEGEQTPMLLQNVPSGNYLLQVTMQGSVYTQKIAVQH